MELGTTLIGAICLAVCVVPFIFIIVGRKKREKELLHKLENIATTHDCKIHKYEICGELAIGIDNNKKIVFYHNESHGSTVENWVDLTEIEQCNVLNICKTIRDKSSNYKTIEKLDLVFVPRNKSLPEKTLTFFNIEDNSQLSGELQLIEEWKTYSNSLLSA